MVCIYCEMIASSGVEYERREAVYDLGSLAPRCAVHWRYICGSCEQPEHFMSLAFCGTRQEYYCRRCASGITTVDDGFFAWDYYFLYRSPWSGCWEPALDRLEYEGNRPDVSPSGTGHPHPELSTEESCPRSLNPAQQWEADLSENMIGDLWDRNAVQWDAGFDADGDEYRKYHSDGLMMELIGDVTGLSVLDAGCGNGYLARKLARAGARAIGIEVSARMVEVARRHELAEPLGVGYRIASVTDLSAFATEDFDLVVCHHVLTSVDEYDEALREMYRVLRRCGRLVVVISHPCFSCGPRRWESPIADTPRAEEFTSYAVDRYFQRGGNLMGAWENFSPVPYFHRPLRDYWQSFRDAGFVVEAFEETSISERGRKELPAWRVRQAERISLSCMFLLTKAR